MTTDRNHRYERGIGDLYSAVNICPQNYDDESVDEEDMEDTKLI